MLVCPICEEPGLIIAQRLKLRADMQWDERMLQAIHCPACDTRFRGEYLEERRGARERIQHNATPISAKLFTGYSAALAAGDGQRAGELAATEPGDSTDLQYRPADRAAPLARHNTPGLPASVATPSARHRMGLFERLRDWLSN